MLLAFAEVICKTRKLCVFPTKISSNFLITILQSILSSSQSYTLWACSPIVAKNIVRSIRFPRQPIGDTIVEKILFRFLPVVSIFTNESHSFRVGILAENCFLSVKEERKWYSYFSVLFCLGICRFCFSFLFFFFANYLDEFILFCFFFETDLHYPASETM